MERSYTLILASVVAAACAQLLLKAGMSSSALKIAADGSGGMGVLLSAARNPLVLGGLAVYFASAALWLLVLSRVEVSIAYPFVALGIAITSLFGWLLFNEALDPWKISGTLLIIIGLVLVTNSR